MNNCKWTNIGEKERDEDGDKMPNCGSTVEAGFEIWERGGVSGWSQDSRTVLGRPKIKNST